MNRTCSNIYLLFLLIYVLGFSCTNKTDSNNSNRENSFTDCQDGFDNDKDGLTDCKDEDCLWHAFCANPRNFSTENGLLNNISSDTMVYIHTEETINGNETETKNNTPEDTTSHTEILEDCEYSCLPRQSCVGEEFTVEWGNKCEVEGHVCCRHSVDTDSSYQTDLNRINDTILSDGMLNSDSSNIQDTDTEISDGTETISVETSQDIESATSSDSSSHYANDSDTATDTEDPIDTASSNASCPYNCLDHKTCESASHFTIHDEYECSREMDRCCEFILDGGLDSEFDGGLNCVEGDFKIENGQELNSFSEIECLIGRLSIVDAQLENIEIPLLQSIYGELRIITNESLQKVVLKSLTEATNIFISNNHNLVLEMDSVTTCDSVTISGNSNIDVSMPQLSNASQLSYSGNSQSSLKAMTSLEEIGSSIVISGNSGVPTLLFPQLRDVGNSVQINGNSDLNTISFSSLDEGPRIDITGNNGLETITLENLQTATNLWIEGNRSLVVLNFNSLDNIDNSLTISHNVNLTDLALPLLKSISGNLQIKGNTLLGCDHEELLSQLEYLGGESKICENLEGSSCGQSICND